WCRSLIMSADRELSTDASDHYKLVRPKVEFHSLLQHAGATKEVFTMKEVMFYLGQYIIQKQLYDQKQQHIVHCSHDELGRVLGVDSFSVKEPRVLFAALMKNLVAVRNQGEITSFRTPVPPGPSFRALFFSLLRFSPQIRPAPAIQSQRTSRRSRRSSDSSSSELHSTRSEVTTADPDSDSDNFSVEFEVESDASDDYNEDDTWVSADDQVYEVTFEAEEEDSFDEDTEITEADYWRCLKCDELNPPLPRNCQRCWALRCDWLPEAKIKHRREYFLIVFLEGSDLETEGVDVPDGRHTKTPPPLSEWWSGSTPSAADVSQDLCSSSQPSSSCSQTFSSSLDSQALLPATPVPESASATPELERSVSAEWRLPESRLDPCLICQSRPKNGCIVHGRTGHLTSCYVCARKLKKRNKMCPVCRMPIQS
uniref:Uncharacterized protein n=1 Tax=Tetraodon nigroviridis TaxID=99883 RepID=H3DPY2_TETNG